MHVFTHIYIVCHVIIVTIGTVSQKVITHSYIRAYDKGQSPDILWPNQVYVWPNQNFLYIINGRFIEFAKENEYLDNFQFLS